MSRKNKASTKKTAQKAIGANAKSKSRNRYQVKVMLDANKDDELLLLEHIDDLKKKRRWLPTFRNALRLFFSLREGRIDVLKELFPGIVELIAGSTPVSKEVQELMALLSAAARNAEQPTPVEITVKPPKPTRDMDYELSLLDTDDDQVTRPSTSVNIAENFMNSMGMFG